LVKRLAHESGFDLVGIAKYTPLGEEAEFLRQWIEDGKHAGMSWMSRTIDKRCDPELVLKGCQSVIVVAVNYMQELDNEVENPPREQLTPMGKVSRYAVLKDYHHEMGERMKQFCSEVKSALSDELQMRWYVDTGPVMEKAWAKRAGIGFIGKNTCLINRQKGSWFFLGVVLTDLQLHPDQPETRHWCGDCVRCIEACPTGALDEVGTLDAGKCISYLTIEHREDVAPALKPHFDGWLFGCDICQEVCPYNLKFSTNASSPNFEQITPSQLNLDEILNIKDEEDFKRIFNSKNPLRRAGREGLQRTTKILKKFP